MQSSIYIPHPGTTASFNDLTLNKDKKIAEKIALDHLAENPHYYSLLKKSKIDPELQ